MGAHTDDAVDSLGLVCVGCGREPRRYLTLRYNVDHRPGVLITMALCDACPEARWGDAVLAELRELSSPNFFKRLT